MGERSADLSGTNQGDLLAGHGAIPSRSVIGHGRVADLAVWLDGT
jgi:hypothetical protein